MKGICTNIYIPYHSGACLSSCPADNDENDDEEDSVDK